jgi:hypothetical protein
MTATPITTATSPAPTSRRLRAGLVPADLHSARSTSGHGVSYLRGALRRVHEFAKSCVGDFGTSEAAPSTKTYRFTPANRNRSPGTPALRWMGHKAFFSM